METSQVVRDRQLPEPELLDVRQVAALLTCSPKHVYRMVDAGKMPAPLKLGSATRWRQAEVLEWIRDGCRRVR